VSARSFWRGHPIIARGDDWFYADDESPVADKAGRSRPCGNCGQDTPAGQVEVDPCLGALPGVDNACCGHGDREEAYIQFTNGVTVRGFVVEQEDADGVDTIEAQAKAEQTQPVETNCKRM